MSWPSSLNFRFHENSFYVLDFIIRALSRIHHSRNNLKLPPLIEVNGEQKYEMDKIIKDIKQLVIIPHSLASIRCE